MKLKQKLYKTKNPFFGYFSSKTNNGFDDKMLQTKWPLFWSKIISWAVKKGIYTFQQSSEGRAMRNIRLNDESLLNISSYDYLGLIGNPEIETASIAAINRFGTGTGGVRLLSGSNIIHEELEKAIADFKETEAAITYSSGFMANLAIISALVEEKDKVFMDEKIHRSLLDACAMAKADYEKFAHNDAEDLRAKIRESNHTGRTFIVLDGVYSMDGSIAKLPDFIAIKKEFSGFLIIDEAHALGVLGKTGRGLHEHYGINAKEVDVWTCSLSKAIPANGGFVAGSRELIIFLQHHSSPYVFSSALNPGSAAAALKSLKIIKEHPEKISKLWENTHYFLERTKALGIDTGISISPITPVIIGDRKRTVQLSGALYQRGILASAAVFPAVPIHQGRLRICMSAAYEKSDIDFLTESLLELQFAHA